MTYTVAMLSARTVHVNYTPQRAKSACLFISVLHMCRWLREEKRQRKQHSNGAKGKVASNKLDLAQWSNGWAPGRMTASIRDSSNTVMRM